MNFFARTCLRILTLSLTGLTPLAGQAAPQGRHIALPGVNLWYTDTGGDGEPLVLLHANTGTSASWQYQQDDFSRAGYRVIAFDRRGSGQSTPDSSSGSQPGTVAQDLDALVMQLGIERFHLLGIAGGGFIALDYAAWHGDKLQSLTVAASTGSIQEDEIQQFIKRIEIPGIREQSATYREVGASYRGANPEGLKKWHDIEAGARQAGVPSQPLRSLNTYKKIGQLNMPISVISAGADLLAPPALMTLWVKHLAQFEWTLIPDAGHAVAWERPEQFNKTVLAFLAKHPIKRWRDPS